MAVVKDAARSLYVNVLRKRWYFPTGLSIERGIWTNSSVKV